MNIIITSEKHCWVCDSDKQITNHHAIPKRLNPKKNVIIPICKGCHEKLHSQDINGFNTMLHRLSKDTINLTKAVSRLRSKIEIDIIK